MKVSWQWVALAAVYFGIAWVVATALIGAFFLGLKFSSLLSVFFVAQFLIILTLCLLGLRDIMNRLNETYSPRKVQRQGIGYRVKIPWQWTALIAPYGCLAWIAAATDIGEFLVSLMFSSIGLIFVLSALPILSLSLFANLTNRNQSEVNIQHGAVMNGENRTAS